MFCPQSSVIFLLCFLEQSHWFCTQITYWLFIAEAKYFIALYERILQVCFRFMEIGERWMQKYFYYLVQVRFMVGKVALGQIFDPSTSVFPVPYLFSTTRFSYQKDKSVKPGNPTKSKALQKWGAFGRKYCN